MFNRGGFPGQMPMGHSPMNQPGMSHPGMNMSGMNVSGMNMPGMGMTPMNQPNMNLSGMNHPGMNHQLMGHSGMNHPNIGLSGMNQSNMSQPNMSNMSQPNMSNMNQSNMNLNPMNHPNMNQGGGMGFLPEMKSQAFGMRPMDSSGSFVGGNADPMGMKGMPIRSPMQMSTDRHMVPQALSQRFSSPNVPVHQGQPRTPAQSQEIPSIMNMTITHASNHMVGNSKAPLQDPANRMKKKRWEENVNAFGSVGQDMGIKSVPSGSEASTAQSRYTNESASSILESFGLSNEDLEELSRYPDDQLTPSNMPSILRDIRLRKMNRTTSVPDQAAGRRPGSEAVQSKVIDYGHSSKYQFNSPAAPAQTYKSPRIEQKLPPAPKETVTVGNSNPDTGMENKIPTISGSRKHVWSSSKLDRSNNKTLVGKGSMVPVNVSVSITEEKPVISSQPDATAQPNVVTPVRTELTAAVQAVTSQVAYQPPTETPAAGTNKWVPVSPKEDVPKMKTPTPSMMNDYYAASPRIFPHICSLCNVECRHLKDWIKHQNNVSHIESCRNLRQKYPEWNPQVLSSVRNDNKKDETSSHKSESKSVSPRRSRRSGSVQTSRSRSPRSSGRRSRSRSPRRSRHSPRRSRSPRPRSPRRFRRSSRSDSPDKRAVDAAVKSFIEAIKPKGAEKSKSVKAANSGKKPSVSNVRSKKPVSAPPKKPGNSASKASSTSSSSSSSKKPAANSNNKPSSNSAARKPTSASASSKPVVSTGAKKTTPSTSSGTKPQPSKPPAEEPPQSLPTPEEAPNLSNKFLSKNNTRKIVHVTDLPDSGYTDQDILKIVQPFGRVCDILIVPSKNEAFIETNFREAAAAVVKYSETMPIMINHKRVTLSLGCQSKKPVTAEKAKSPEKEPAKPPVETAAPEKENEDKKTQEPSKHDLDVPPGFIKSYMLEDPPLKPNEKCVILISNLPEVQYTVEEIANLAKPFGGVNDLLVVANHRKAYLELTSKNNVDSMIKFYGVFPTYLGGNLLSMCIAQRYKDLKNEDLIFADLIEQSSYKIIPTIYEKFVHLTDLPEKDVEDFEIIRIGRRFGKVEHHVYFSNKKKAILHLHSPSAAKAMYSFLTQYPCSIADTVVQCSLPPKTELSEDEYISYIEEDAPRTDSNSEKAASEAAESNEPDKKEEKSSQAKEKGSNEPAKKEEKPSQPKEKGSNEPDKKEEKPSQPKEGSKEPNKDEQPSQLKDKGSKEPNKDEKPSLPKDKGSKEPTKKDEKPSQPKDKGSKEPSKDEKSSQHKDRWSREPNKDEKSSQHKDKWSREPSKKDDKASQHKDKGSKEPTKKDEKPSQHKDKWSKEPNKKDDKPSQHKSKWSKEPNRKDEKSSQHKEKWSKEPNKKDEKPSQPKDKGSKEPNKKDEKPSQPKGKESEVGPSQSKMDVDTAECERATEPEKTSGQGVADNPSIGLVPSPLLTVTTEDDDDEEAAEAPEAPDTSHVCIQAEPEVQHPEPQPVSRPQVSDDLDVLVSVESDEEESEEPHNVILNAKQGTQPLPVTYTAKLLETQTSGDKGPNGSSESEGKAVTKDAQNTIGTAGEGSYKETPKHGLHVPTKGRDELVAPEASETSDVSMVRTTKYNPQKGDISVTVTLENQKSSSKTESRKRTSRERGSSSHESSTPRSSSNRSSPADSASKSGSNFSQKKTTGKYSSSQPERDSKDTRSREREPRSTSKWDQRMRGSSSRYSRSSKNNNRSPRSKEEDEETFPFNLDEFVTVDEIVEEQVDSMTSAEADEEKLDDTRKGKRKENDTLPSDAKKPRVTSTASHKQSFVTLDEVGGEEENADVQEDQANKTKPLVTLDTEGGTPPSTKDEQMLMTLDEISDDDDAQNSFAGQQSSKVPEIITKDQLLTLDEVNEEEEERTTSTKPQEVVETKLLEDKDIKNKDDGKEPEDKHKSDIQQDAPTKGDGSEQALLTLDEVKAEDDEMPFADIEHKFLTVDEIGEEEEESERKAASKPSETKESSKAEPTSTPKRGRPRKRPLPQSADDNKDSSVQAPPDTSKGDSVEKSPAKPKPSQGSEGEAEGSTSESPAKMADGKSDADTLAKKAKLETPPAEKIKLAPFNSSTPVGMEFLVPKTGYFCELCSLFYMDELSKLKHCRSLKHYQAVEKHLAKLEVTSEGKSSST